MTDDISHPYKVILHGSMPALAWIWLRNNQVDYQITYGFDYDADERMIGEKVIINFSDATQAHWFALRWTK